MSIRKRIRSFIFALKGIKEAMRGANFIIQFVCMLLAFVLAFVLDFSNVEWAIVVLISVVVLAAEVFNTAIEYVVDFVSPEHHEMAGKIKDMAAGAVLVTAIGAIVIACVLYLPKILVYVS